MILMYKISFGTSGWRDKMNSGFNDENVLRAAYGIGIYLKKKSSHSKVIVGYDTRKNSRHFAELICGIFGGFGLETFIIDSPTPTPVVSFAVLNTKASAGIAVTASHNPPIYNGIKFLDSSGATPVKETTDQITALIPEKRINPLPCSAESITIKDAYLDALGRRFDLGKIRGMHVAIDTMHGAGRGYLADLLVRYGADVHELNENYDAEFGGKQPIPSEENLQELKDLVKRTGSVIGIANDGDADRFAAVDADGNYYTANQSGLMMCDYLFKYRNEKGDVARSIHTTSAMDRLCATYGVKCTEVPVGFKNISKELAHGAVFGLEGASQGAGFGGWIPDKDGIAAGALICEMLSVEKQSFADIWKSVSKKFGFGCFLAFDINKTESVVANLNKLKGMSIGDNFAGRKTVKLSLLDGIKLYLNDGSWVLVRESGTEPLVRAFAEANSKSDAEKLVEESKRFLSGK